MDYALETRKVHGPLSSLRAASLPNTLCLFWRRDVVGVCVCLFNIELLANETLLASPSGWQVLKSKSLFSEPVSQISINILTAPPGSATSLSPQ